MDHLSWLRDLIWTADSGAGAKSTGSFSPPYITKVYMIPQEEEKGDVQEDAYLDVESSGS